MERGEAEGVEKAAEAAVPYGVQDWARVKMRVMIFKISSLVGWLVFQLF
jgi:hypothetical protein